MIMPGTAPVADSLTAVLPAGQTSLRPGQSCTVTLTGHDADARTVPLSGFVSDAAGNTSGTLSLNLVISDPITYTLTAPLGSGLTIVPVAGQPGAFTVSA